MKTSKKAISASLALIMLIGTASCGSGNGGTRATEETTAATTTEDTNKELEEDIDYANMAEIDEIDAKNEEGTGPLYVSGQKAGAIKTLCYYDLAASEPELAEMLAQRYGGFLETEITSSGSAYFERINMMIASGDSPDLVRYDWEAFPAGMMKKMYTPLDDWLDIDSPLWAGEKDIIESFSLLGKHYYFPANIQSNFAIVYNKAVLGEVGLEDPMDLYDRGEWNWNTFESMMKAWVEQGEDYIGFTGGQWSAMMFANTTGVKVIDMTGTELINNMRDLNVQRTMDWLTGLKKDGIIGDGFIHPIDAFIDGKLLFLGMGLVWGYESAQEGMWKNGLDAEIAVVPFPKDPQADKYYLPSDSFGYMVPAGAKNIQGAVDWILCSRIYETDPEIIAQDRAEKMDTNPVYYAKCPSCKYNFVENGKDDLDTCPECDAARKQKFKVTYSERQLDLIADMIDPTKFEFVFDGSLGLGDDFSKLFINQQEESIFDGPIYYGTSYTQVRDTYYNVVEAYLEPYREILKEGQAG